MIRAMEIKRISDQYIKDVAVIEKACFSKPWDENTIAEELKNSFSHFYVAVENGSAVGFIVLHVLTGEADIVRVGVLPQYRKRGIARAMLERSLEDAHGEVFLDVRESNAAAIALYRSFGFRDTGVRRDYYSEPTENALIMKRNAVERGNRGACAGN